MNKKGFIYKIFTKIKKTFKKQEMINNAIEPTKKDVLSDYYVGKYKDDNSFHEDVKKSMFNALASSQDWDKNMATINMLFAMKKWEDTINSASTSEKVEEEPIIDGGHQKSLTLRRRQYTIH